MAGVHVFFFARAQDLVDAYQIVVPLEYIPQRCYGDGADASMKRSMAGTQPDMASSKGAARGVKKSKSSFMTPVAAVALDDVPFARCVRWELEWGWRL